MHSCEMQAVLVVRRLMLLQAVHHDMPCCSSQQVLKVRPQLCIIIKICRGKIDLVLRRWSVHLHGSCTVADVGCCLSGKHTIHTVVKRRLGHARFSGKATLTNDVHESLLLLPTACKVT